MKEERKRELYRYIAVIFGIILIALILCYIYYPKYCDYNRQCLDKSFSNCERANSFLVLNGNTYLYSIKGYSGDYCKMDIKVMEATGSDAYTRSQIENKAMSCKIPKEDTNVSVDNVNNMLDYCTGPLKESMLELIIKKLYEVIVANIGPITKEMQNSLNKTL